MMEITNLIHIFGWTIINSLWQSLFIAILLSIVLLFINPKHAKIRSMLAFASLILVFAASVRTYSDLSYTKTKSIQNDNHTVSIFNSDMIIFHDTPSSNNEEDKASNSVLDSSITTVSNFAGKNLSYVVVIWFAGFLILTFRMLGGYFYMQRIKTKQVFEIDQKWLNILLTISEHFGIKKTVGLLESAIVKFPTVIGYFKPVILMPLGSLAEMSVDQVEMILAHELAHIKRSDYLLNLIQSFLEIIYFFNPSVWVISKIIRNEREYACDDMALSINDNSMILAKALLSVHQKESKRPVVAISALGTKNSILWRIKRMVQKNNTQTNYPKKLALSFLLIGSLFAISVIACSTTTDTYKSGNEVQESTMSFSSTLPTPVFNKPKNAKPSAKVKSPEEIEILKPVTNFSKSDNTNGKRNFNFHNDETHWRGIEKDGKVIELYKDDVKVSQNNIGQYEDYILDTLKEIDEDMAEFEIDMKDFKIDMTKLKKDLSDLKIDINLEGLNGIKEHFNSDEFHKEMKELKESLHKMKFEFNDEWHNELKEVLKNKEHWDIDLEHFKSDEFKHEMTELKHELDQIKDLDIDFDFDKESFKESMKELKENMKDFKIDMSDLDIDLSNLKIDLKDLKVEMKKLKSFMKDLRKDLVSESYIDNSDEDFEMDLTNDYVTVNDKKLPDSLHKRYLAMYKKHFGKELEKDFRIHN
jgi:bla regulator protein blaR1